MLITSTPLSRSSFIVPPVAITSQPSARTLCELHDTRLVAYTYQCSHVPILFFAFNNLPFWDRFDIKRIFHRMNHRLQLLPMSCPS